MICSTKAGRVELIMSPEHAASTGKHSSRSVCCELGALSKKGLNTKPYLFPHKHSFELIPKNV